MVIFIKQKINKPTLTPVKTKVVLNLMHELRSPLFNIKSFLETIYEYHFQLSDKQILEFLEVANQEVNRLVRLINNNLDNFKLSSNTLLYDTFLIESLSSFLVKSYEISALRKSLVFYFKLHKSVRLQRVQGNWDLMSQVLTNLISNSLKFTYPFGFISLKVKKLSVVKIKQRIKKNIVRLDLVDSGIGISKESVNTLLKSADSVSINPYFLESTGLGFSIVKDILAKSNNWVYIISGKKKGVCVFINLFM